MEIDDNTEAGLRKGGGSDHSKEDILHLVSWALYRQDNANPYIPFNTTGVYGQLRTKMILQEIRDVQSRLGD